MAGNVSEWVADWYDTNYYSQSPERNPPGPDSGERWGRSGEEMRVIRGGSWLRLLRDARCACRNMHNPRHGDNTVGFRCARSE